MGLRRYEYLFTFDNTFEIHDDSEVLKRMGMALGLNNGKCSQEDLQKALKLVPKALEPYVLGKIDVFCFIIIEVQQLSYVCVSSSDMAKVNRNGSSRSVLSSDVDSSSLRVTDPHMLPPSAYSDNSMDSEVAGLTMPTNSALVTSFTASHSPDDDDDYSDGSSDRSSPIDI